MISQREKKIARAKDQRERKSHNAQIVVMCKVGRYRLLQAVRDRIPDQSKKIAVVFLFAGP